MNTERQVRLFRNGRNQALRIPRLYLLDTTIVSHLVRQPQGPVADHIADVGETYVLTSVIVACELRYRAAKRGSKKLTRQVEAVLSAMTIRDQPDQRDAPTDASGAAAGGLEAG